LQNTIFEEQPIVAVTIAGDAAVAIMDATGGPGLVEALDHSLYPADKKKGMKDVQKLAADLNILDQELLLLALKHAVETRDGSVTFSLQKTDYLIEVGGLEVKDRQQDEGPLTPVAIVFIKQQ